MRLRRKPWIDEAIHEYDDYVYTQVEDNMKGQWRKKFEKQDNHFHVELGTGKGQFIAGMASAYPQTNFLGLEVQIGVLYYAAKKLFEQKLANGKVMLFDIAQIENILEEGEVDRFYINFCDPWPKARHAKRRLTHRSFLSRYEKLLGNEGEIFFKTDNKDLFEFSLDEFQDSGWQLRNITYDLHQTDLPNVKTEYEIRFSEKGQHIYRLEAIKPNTGGLHGDEEKE